MSIPGIGPLTAMAIQAFAPPMESFRRGRDFSAWLGLVPRQHSTGGKPKLGKISKMGQRDLRRLLVVGAMATIGWAVRRGTKDPRAGPDAGAQTTHAGRGGAGQPHGAHRLGADDEERILPRAGRHRLSRRSRFVTVGNASRSEDGKGKRSTRRGRENQTTVRCLRAHWSDFGPDPRISIQARGGCYAAINEAGHTTAPDRMHRTISRNELSPETGGGPRCAQSASTSRTVTRGCQPASRVLRSAPALAGDCRGRPCGKPLRASQKAGPRSTGTRGRLREPLRCRGEPIQRTRERRVRRYRGDSEKACNLGGVHTRQLPGGIRTR